MARCFDNIEETLAYACSFAEMERQEYSQDDPFYLGYIHGMAEMIHLGYYGDDCLYQYGEIEEFIMEDVEDRRKHY